ncbi:DUF4282 domain-containing protein [Mesorhizobium sp. BR1-1-16]|uniref:DUF4282 domain-containing protein n=1 Tax=Mesorhizobium sp. BR1-1-16 TaxID=2876653 RepID=UPI001CCC8233|nr:DUF4282 domain-containing protein [Mesorhizobium sp. BR1-1-16]MBZ9936438.1 DUF4282 domain-containing protein [Mesorhizobium sp. BR1-1-16]
MNSFFDVFKWDRFVAPSAMELLFWLVSAVAVLFGIWGLVAGLAMVNENALPGLILIAVSIIGTLVAIIAARVACEAIVILFRVNENLMDIAERGGLAPQPPAMSESDTARLDRRAADTRERPAARSEPTTERPAIDHRPAELNPAQPEDRARDPFAPDQGRVEPKAWDVRPAESRVSDAKPVVEIEPVEPPVRVRETSAESRTTERRTPPTIVLPDRSEPKAPQREIRRPGGRPDPAIEHALKRLSEPSSSEAMRSSLAEGLESQLVETRPQAAEITPALPEPRRPAVAAPAESDDVTALPAFIGTRHSAVPEPADEPVELPPGLARDKARRRNGQAVDAVSEVEGAAPISMPPTKVAFDEGGTVAPKVSPLRAPAAKQSESERDKPKGQQPQKSAGKNRGNARHQPAKGGQAPLKRRRPPRPDQDGG